MTPGKPLRKHVFDVALIVLLSPFILVVLSISALAIILSDGVPVVYRSSRRVYRNESRVITKFRTMRRNADRIANRDTVAVERTRFLNIPSSSPLYTPVGRWIERLMITEMPQLLHVIAGWMSIVGNRPLPENVIISLKDEFPDAEARFLVVAGLTGPIQLIGRDAISDADRLRLEHYYCCLVLESYSMLLDAKILFYTVCIGLHMHRPMTVQQVSDLLANEAARQSAIQAASNWSARVGTALATLIPKAGGRGNPRSTEFAASVLERQRMRMISGASGLQVKR